MSTANSNTLVGKCCLIRTIDEESIFGGFISRIRVESDLLDPEYAYLWLSNNAVQSHLRRRSRQTTNIANLPPNDVLSTFIVIPPFSEQRRIVEILNEARDIRCLRQKADDLTTQLIPAIFNEMFGDPLLNPKDWPVEPLSRAYRIKPNYGTMTPADPSGDGVLCIRVGDIQDNQLDLANAGLVPHESIDEKRHLVRTGDVVLVRAIGSIDHLGKSVVVEEQQDGIAFDSHLMRVRFDPKKLLPHFVHSLFITPGGRRLFLKNTRQSVVQVNINTDEYGRIRIPIPPLELQATFVARVNDVRHCRKHQDAARTLETMMQQSLLAYAFSGELTADWRSQNLELLAREASDRDRWFRENGVKILIADNRIHDRHDDSDGRIAALNREQRKLLEQIQNLDPNENGGTFTLSSISKKLQEPLDTLSLDSVRRHLDVLVSLGLIKAVSQRAGGGGSVGLAFGNAYRLPKSSKSAASLSVEPDLVGSSEVARLSGLGKKTLRNKEAFEAARAMFDERSTYDSGSE